MKSIKKSLLRNAVVYLIVLLTAVAGNTSARDYYQIKIYTIKSADQETRIDNYLKNAYIPAMHRAGFKTVGVFKPVADDAAAGTKIFVLIPLKKLSDIEKIEEKLSGDKELQSAGTEYINAPHDNPPYERIESILLRAFSDYPETHIPNFDTPTSEQIFELRSYQGPTEKIWKSKVEMFNEGGEVGIFKELNFNPVFFGEVLSGCAMPNLMYMTSFSDIASNKDLWDDFGKHPDWKRISGMEMYQNNVSHIDKWLLHPADYSDI